MVSPDPLQCRSFFRRFGTTLGPRQIEDLLGRFPQWWSYRDSEGCTGLMHLLGAKGFSWEMLSDLLSQPDVAQSAHVCDHHGRTLWWYMLYHRAWRDDRAHWVKVMPSNLPLVHEGSPGLLADHIVQQASTPRGRGWSGFFPREQMGRAMQMRTPSGFAQWWGCTEENATRVGQWLYEKRRQYSPASKALTDNLCHCFRNDPAGFWQLPGPLRGALGLWAQIFLPEVFPEVDPDFFRDGTCLPLSRKALQRIETEKQATILWHVISKRILPAWNAHESAVLAWHTQPAPVTHATPRRL